MSCLRPPHDGLPCHARVKVIRCSSRRKQRHAVMLSLPPPSLAVLRHIHSILASQIESFSPGMIFFPLAPAFPTQICHCSITEFHDRLLLLPFAAYAIDLCFP